MTLQKFTHYPKLVVFDLDYTLWPFYCDTHVSPPFHRRNECIFDSNESRVNVYRDSEPILKFISEHKDMNLACASRTSAINVAKQLLQIMNWDNYFDFKEIYPGSKIAHFKRLQEQTGFAFDQMMFFDDEPRNIRDLEPLGVHCHLVKEGVNWSLFETAMTQFNNNKQNK